MKKVLKRILVLGLAIVMSVSMTGLECLQEYFPRAYASEGGVELKVHYHRADGAYEPWSVWLWEEGKDGNDYKFSETDGEQVATMEVTPGTMAVGFIVRTESWDKDISEDQYIDISEVASGTVHAYIESGVPGYELVLGDDVVKGIKVKTVVAKAGHVITVTMTSELESADDTFTVLNKGNALTIKNVNYIGNAQYEVEVDEELSSFGIYYLTFEGLNYRINMENIYSTKEFEDQYTYTGKDLGATWTKDSTAFRVWAPTADEVSVRLYKGGDARLADKDLISEIRMDKDVNGTWIASVNEDLNGTYYTYKVSVNGRTNEACDPYAVTTGVNGNRAMVIDLSSTNPDGWDQDKNPNAGKKITDAIIYEGHIRDLTVGDTGITNKGKYLGVVETGTKSENGIPTGLDHMKDLGITHLHILPMYDFGSVDELKTVSDIYNWGYDPVNYNVPEGSYSTDPTDGAVRVKEAKEMVKKLHDNGISVVMDVVYNHVFNAGDYCFNKIVPGYFSRVSDNGTYSSGSGCGNDTASERTMVRKYIVESVNYWASEYHIDGFRFDLVGLLDVDTINEIVSTVHETHPDVIFYGEGWSMSTMVTKDDVLLATQVNSEKTPSFAYFNDTIRDGIKGSVFNKEPGFVAGAKGYDPKIERCFLGADSWCKSPSQTINYASCHDNNTLIDRITLSCKDASREELIDMNKLAAAIYMTSEGVPFMQAGEELLRSKVNADGSFNENSYNAGDKVNAIDYASLALEENREVYEYYKGLISIRKNHPALRLETSEAVSKAVKPISTGASSVVGFTIDGTDILDETAQEMVIIFNASKEDYNYMTDGSWKVLVNKDKASNTPVLTLKNVSGLNVEAGSCLVAVKDKKYSHKAPIAGIIAGALLIAVGTFIAIWRKKK